MKSIEERAKEQKAIDEEVRLKKSDSMTQAEYDREVAFADWYLKNGTGTPTYSDAIEWERKEVINKACELLKAVSVLADDDSIMGFIKARKEVINKACELLKAVGVLTDDDNNGIYKSNGGIIMTIEERAKEYASKKADISLSAVYNEALASIYEEGYIAGATEQKIIDINKAREWFADYLMEIGYPDDWMRDSLNIKSGKERFRKAMEE